MTTPEQSRKTNRPYKFQNMVFNAFLEGDDILLQALAGAGKTRAATRPGLCAFESDYRTHPQKMIYIAPMRVLVSSQFNEIKQISQTNSKWLNNDWRPSIQTGEHPEDPKFEGRLIFATVDQVLASFLNIPYGLPSRFDNLNAGAFIGSYLIFDEFHLYPSQQMLLTVLAMLKMLKGITRFALMTATFSRALLDTLERTLEARVIADAPDTPLSKGIFSDILRLQNQHRTWHAREGILRTEEIQCALGYGDRVLVICNTVDRAQTVYADLSEADLPGDVEICLLHSRFYQQDRSQHEKTVLRWLSEEPELEGRYIVVATQVVEVGLDISADVLLTECAPAASLIQRAGRCVRWGGEGEVWVYQPPIDARSGEVSYAPYHADGLLDVSRKTWDALCSSTFDGQILHYDGERKLIDHTHTDHDHARLIDGLDQRIERRIDEITQCMRERHNGFRHQLIRENSQASLYIMPDPNQTLDKNLGDFEAFSISQGRIAHEFEKIQSGDVDTPFIVAGATESNEQISEDERQVTTYHWRPLKAAEEAYQYWSFTAHPQAARYDAALGLRWTNPDGMLSPTSPRHDQRRKRYEGYNADTYTEHVISLMNAYKKPAAQQGYPVPLRMSHAYALHRVLDRCGIEHTQETIDQMILLMLALHDLGKLNQRWQDWAQTRQATFAAHIPNTRLGNDATLLAHTDTHFTSDEEKTQIEDAFRAQRAPTRGTHAVEGALASYHFLHDATQDNTHWFNAITAAICQHHTPGIEASRPLDFDLHPDAHEAIAITLKAAGFSEQQVSNWVENVPARFKRAAPPPIRHALRITQMTTQDYTTPLLYYLLVRILRLADHRSSDYLTIYPVEEA
jgi:CRISPR-associated endonuclease/helicase Cas3